LSRDCAAGLLAGVLLRDALKTDRKRIRFSVTSPGLCLLVRYLLWGFGFPASYREQPKTKKKAKVYITEVGVYNAFSLISSLLSLDFQKIEFLSLEKISSNRFCDNKYLYFYIKQKTYQSYRGKVFDFTVSPKQRYLTSGAMLHNSPQVNLEDIKMKIVKERGGDLFEYDIWPEQVRVAAGRPYLEQAVKQLQSSPTDIQRTIRDILVNNRISDININVVPISNGGKHEVDLQLEENRSSEIKEYWRRYRG
jgi:hypothetical protein